MQDTPGGSVQERFFHRHPGGPLFRRLVPDDEHRARRVAEDVLGHAAQKDPAQPFAPVRSHDDQIEAARPGEPKDFLLRIAVKHDGRRFFPRRNGPDHELKAVFERDARILEILARGNVRNQSLPLGGEEGLMAFAPGDMKGGDFRAAELSEVQPGPEGLPAEC